MELQKLIVNNQLNSFNKIKNVFGVAPYHMNVKGNDERCIIISDNYRTPLNNIFVEMVDGCVIDPKNMKVICYFPHMKRRELQYQEDVKTDDIRDWDKTTVEELIDGTVIRLYYDNEWKIATLRTMDAKNAYWLSEKSFKDLFLECCSLDFEKLNKSHIYGFIICHPNNKIVTHYKDVALVHIMTINKDNDFKTIEVDLGVIKPKKLIFNNFEQMIQSCMKLQFYFPGYLLTDENGSNTKYIAPHYTHVKNLKGNLPNIEIRYLEMRNSSEFVNEFLIYFPEYTQIVQSIETKIINKTNDLYLKYVDIKIHKKWYNLDQIDKQIIYKIHENYLETKMSINFRMVYKIFTSMPYYKIAMALNIPLHKITVNKNPSI